VRYFVHEFRVRMVVEDVPSAANAKRWIEARLNGGDATFEVEHTGAIRELTSAESDALYTTGKIPSGMKYRIRMGLLNWWFIVHPTRDDLAWSGSQWVEHQRGVGLYVQVSNFSSREAADATAQEQIS
jgi:hypothetical protein